MNDQLMIKLAIDSINKQYRTQLSPTVFELSSVINHAETVELTLVPLIGINPGRGELKTVLTKQSLEDVVKGHSIPSLYAGDSHWVKVYLIDQLKIDLLYDELTVTGPYPYLGDRSQCLGVYIQANPRSPRYYDEVWLPITPYPEERSVHLLEQHQPIWASLPEHGSGMIEWRTVIGLLAYREIFNEPKLLVNLDTAPYWTIQSISGDQFIDNHRVIQGQFTALSSDLGSQYNGLVTPMLVEMTEGFLPITSSPSYRLETADWLIQATETGLKAIHRRYAQATELIIDGHAWGPFFHLGRYWVATLEEDNSFKYRAYLITQEGWIETYGDGLHPLELQLASGTQVLDFITHNEAGYLLLDKTANNDPVIDRVEGPYQWVMDPISLMGPILRIQPNGLIDPYFQVMSQWNFQLLPEDYVSLIITEQEVVITYQRLFLNYHRFKQNTLVIHYPYQGSLSRTYATKQGYLIEAIHETSYRLYHWTFDLGWVLLKRQLFPFCIKRIE